MDHSLIIFLFFYIYPLIMMLLSGWLDKYLSAVMRTLRVPDVVAPYLLASVYVMNGMAFNHPWYLYYFIGLIIFGMCLASLFYFKGRSFQWRRFVRIWWRFVFFITWVVHTGLGLYILWQWPTIF